MLVLARKVGETIEVDGGSEAGGVTITLVSMRANSVRLGIRAPVDRPIYRGEIADAIREEHAQEASN